MRLDQIALGATYQLHAREVGNPLVVAEAVTVDYTCTPGLYRPEAALKRALVYVYESRREVRYPVDPRHLHPVT